jgi:hypothetical protein
VIFPGLKLEPQIKIQIGTSMDAIYIPICTSAPESYDGFGTLTIVHETDLNDKPIRYCIVRQEHFEWQTMRWHSGGHRIWQEDDLPLRWIEEQLVERLVKK